MAEFRGRWVFAAIFGLGGAAILAGLGVWQIDRLGDKQARIRDLERQLAAAPLMVDGAEQNEQHNFSPAIAEGMFDLQTPPARFLSSLKMFGAGFRDILPFELTNGRRIMVDRGFTPERTDIEPPPGGRVEIRGALHWPRESNRFTPEPNLRQRIWFARDVDSLSAALNAEPVLLVLASPARADDGGGRDWPRPLPVGVDLPNNHLSYAITWFTLCAIWLTMTAAFVLRRG